jgi:hypothetical protein
MSEFKNWGDYKEALLEGLDSKRSRMLGVLMETAHKENIAATGEDQNAIVVESTSPGSTVTSHISRYDMLFMPLIRRAMPALVGMELAGVQPMPGPRGIVRTIRKMYSETTLAGEYDATEVADGGGRSQPSGGTEASGWQQVFDKYSKLALGGYYDEVDDLDPFEQTVYLEGNRGKPMNLEVVTDTVETQSRKLAAAYSLEAADDLQALDGLDIEAEISETLGDEIIRELDREIINELNALAGEPEGFDFADVDGRYAGEKLAALTIALDNLSASIAMKIRKSGATWMLVSQRVFTALKNASNTTFVPVNRMENTQLNIGSSLFVGTFSGNINVYVDPYAESDYVTMGYKGSEIDTGFFYLPYIPLASSGVVRNPETGDHRILMRTRYALKKFTDTTKSLGNSPDFYARANIENLMLGFKNESTAS